MNWHSTSRVLIVILLLIDLIVGGALYREARSASHLPSDMTAEALQNLAAKDITFAAKPDTRVYTVPIYTYSTQNGYADAMRENARDTYPSLLSAISYLVGKNLSFVEENGKYFDTPDGLSLSIGDGNDSALAAAVIAGTTHFEFVRAELSENPLEDLSDSDFPAESEAVPSSVRKALSGFFGAVYGDAVSYSVRSHVKKDDFHLVRCDVTVREYSVYGMELYAAVQNGRIDALNGDLFFSPPAAAYNASLLDAINILYSLKLPQGASAEVLSETLYYSFYRYDASEHYLIPAWEIIYRAGDGTEKTVLLNALTGAPAAGVAVN